MANRPERCKECDSEHLLWHVDAGFRDQGNSRRLVISAFLSCEECFETLTTVDEDEINEMLNGD